MKTDGSTGQPSCASSKTEGIIKAIPQINGLGVSYAQLPDGPAKEARLLELCQCFHQYLMKYLSMICRGHIPTWGSDVRNSWTNSDIKGFLYFFMPKGEKLNQATCSKICKTLHLAFKGKTTDEIYDVLMEQLIRAIRRYDPAYSDKTRQVVEMINGKLSHFREITLADVNRHLEFDGAGHLRMLVKRGHLETVVERGRITAYVRKNWPPDASIYKHPVGITYCIQTWFRLYLQDWIVVRMAGSVSASGKNESSAVPYCGGPFATRAVARSAPAGDCVRSGC
jgi:hypothetical protein